MPTNPLKLAIQCRPGKQVFAIEVKPASRLLCIIVATLVVLTGCTVAKETKGQSGESELVIQCGLITSMANCHERASKECPNGYVTLEKHVGVNRKEITVRCK
ncbi:MAG: hypothetical protein COS34_02610 [Lysobacterales bacterium CG02_land_8_20_14_3_00_62_12]|nr:MAG: hypothetical protein COS34_02610 [Xanthomonadales bacterium CG02_land_8_20_14_3_00_62_12]